MESNHFFYVLECRDGSYYAGYTNDLEKRVRVHNKGKGARYTRSRLPVKMIYYEQFCSKSDALKAEYRFKQFKRHEKEGYMQERREYHAATEELPG
ncbi:GIY-YIG nuclease family protein [Bacillus sp. 165]|uniref:GIY-YIG nuclease family protein n=1 Tax=Bacillus sp. 165 TaxID=1529117 RepID=UPI001ADD3E0C|nr:GIY-YIG nuclease family protein [Bacillus sp. 165]MBO9131285.1 GIY-YIG nuclease family protein [Bacillus sp. 165]